HADARWRDEQLLRLKEEVFDLEETRGGVTLADFALDDFRADLLGFARANEQALRRAPLGLQAIVPNAIEGSSVDPGVILCLRRRGPWLPWRAHAARACPTKARRPAPASTMT